MSFVKLVKHTSDLTDGLDLIINEKELTLKAKSLWFILNSQPNGWQVSDQKLAKYSADGPSSVRNGILELLEQRFLVWCNGVSQIQKELHLYKTRQKR